MKKEEQIRMLLHPERYTDEQLNQMLDEVEVPVPDAGEAWESMPARRGSHSEMGESRQGETGVPSILSGR